MEGCHTVAANCESSALRRTRGRRATRPAGPRSRQFNSPLDLSAAHEARSSQAADRLAPFENLLHAFADALADRISGRALPLAGAAPVAF